MGFIFSLVLLICLNLFQAWWLHLLQFFISEDLQTF